MAHIVIVTSAQPAANPRMIKEATALQEVGYHVTVVWSTIAPWADEFDQLIFNRSPAIDWIQAGYHHKHQKIQYFFARARQKYWQIINRLFGNVFDASIKSQVLFSQELIKKATGIKADLYIGHNLGALPAIVKAAKLHNAKSIFDFEDFHRGEHRPGSLQNKAVIDVEDKYIPHVHGITASSSMIAQAYEKIYTDKKIITINNVFPLSFAVKEVIDIPVKPLKLFWFSQYIGKKRGLEMILQAMSKFKKNEISLTLLGTVSNEMRDYFQNYLSVLQLSTEQLIFLDPVVESTIPEIASHYHIGNCSEVAHIENRDLCLTNKLFMYLLSGNALLLSNTKAQQSFLNEYPDIGMSFEQESAESISKAFQFYIDYPDVLNQHRFNAVQLAKTKLNWDTESVKWLSFINDTNYEK